MSVSLQVRRREEQFISDDRRVITRLFRPGDEGRIKGVLGRVLSLSESEASAQLAEVLADFARRHKDLESVFEDHFLEVSGYLDPAVKISDTMRRLIGAYFTMEYSIESAALFNPSIVPHVSQEGLPAGSLRFIMSLRATGEGHISSIVFRTGVIDASCGIRFDELSPYVASARPDPHAEHDKKRFFLKLIEMGAFNELAGTVLDQLSDRFTFAALEQTIAKMRRTQTSVGEFNETAEQMLWLSRSNYNLSFPPDCPISEVVIFPVTENESRGIEDARFVQFVEDDGSVVYYGTYTAYNGFRVLPQLLRTQDFSRFNIIALNGKCVQNKGMALFPRKINGRYMMISRLDGERLHIMSSTNIRFWNEATELRCPEHPWEFVQIGNCGSPIETDAGWLLLTHGVGAMRRYCIGVALLDGDDPSRVIAHSPEPLIRPNEKERDGYVPNVVYSCGAMIHNGELIIPYAMADSATSIATIPVDELLSHLLG